MELERIECKAGEKIITIGGPGEHFYILLEGQGEVLTDMRGAFGGASFALGPGNYFGEEALVAKTKRNATVRMKTDGAIGRLDSAQFDSIFRSALIQTIGLAKAKSFLEASQTDYAMLDVRTEAEFRKSHVKSARNLSITTLRKEIANLEPNTTYLITPAGDPRSDLGVFLLRQAGMIAFILTK